MTNKILSTSINSAYFSSLAKNRINYFDCAAFGYLEPHDISRVNLEKNKCIDESFSDLNLLKYATEKNCMKFDFLNNLEKLQLEVDNLAEQLRSQSILLNRIIEEWRITNERKVINFEMEDDDGSS